MEYCALIAIKKPLRNIEAAFPMDYDPSTTDLNLLYSNRFCKVTWLIDVTFAHNSYVV